MSKLNVSVIQSEIIWEDISANLQKFGTIISSIEAESDLILLPEMFTTGFSMNSANLAETMSGSTINWMQTMAMEKNASIAGSAIIKENNQVFNRLLVAHPDKTVEHYDKRHLFRMSDENDHFSAGNNILNFKLKNWLIRPLICYDLRFPVWSRNNTNYQVLVYSANWPSARRDVWLSLLKARALENQCYTIGINRIGEDGNGTKYSGDSVIFDYKGNLIADAAAKDCVLSATFSLSDLNKFKEKFPTYLDADQFIIKK